MKLEGMSYMASRDITLDNQTDVTTESWNITVLNDLNHVMFRRLAPAIAVLILVMVVSVAGNTVICYIFMRKLRRSNQNFLLLSLGIFDLLSASVGIPSEIWDMRHYYLYDSAAACKAMRFLTTFPTLSSILVLLVIAVDRYRKICKPLHHQMHLPHSRICLVVIVIIALLFSVPTLYIYGHRTFPTPIPGINGHDCSIADEYKDRAYPLVYELIFTVLFVLSTFILVAIYVRIWMETRRHKEYMKTHAMVGKNSIDDTYSSTNYDSSIENIANSCTDVTQDSSFKSRRSKLFIKRFHKKHGRQKTLKSDNFENTERSNGELPLKVLNLLPDHSSQFSSDESIVNKPEWHTGEINNEYHPVGATDDSLQLSEESPPVDEHHLQTNHIKKSDFDFSQSETDEDISTIHSENESQNPIQTLAAPEFDLHNSEGRGHRNSQESQHTTTDSILNQFQPAPGNVQLQDEVQRRKQTHQNGDSRDTREKHVSLTNDSSNSPPPGILSTDSKPSQPLKNQSKEQNDINGLFQKDINEPDLAVAEPSKVHPKPAGDEISSSQPQLGKENTRHSRVSFFNASNEELSETPGETEGLQSSRFSALKFPNADRFQRALVKSKSTQSLMAKRVKKALKATRTTFIACVITIGFIVSYLPHLILIILRSVKTDFEHHLDDVPLNFYNIFLRSYFANNVLNIFVYGSMNLEFRSQLVILFKRRNSSSTC